MNKKERGRTMTVVMIKNDRVFKMFKKYFPTFTITEMENWIKEKFNCERWGINRTTRTIYLYY